MSDQNHLSREHELLLLSAGLRADGPALARIQELLSDRLDWPGFLDACTHHLVAPLVYERWVRSGLLSRCQDDVRDALKHVHRYTAARTLALLADMSRVAAAFEAAGLRFAVFKGLSHAIRDYRSLAARMMADVDVLVAAEHFAETQRILEDLGYEAEAGRSEEYWEQYHRRRAFSRVVSPDLLLGIELHQEIGLRPSAPVRIDAAALLERSVRIEHTGAELPALQVEDELLVMACHQYQHEFETLRCPCDMATMLQAHPDLDWDTVAQRARSSGLRIVLYAALLLAQKVLNVRPPAEVMDTLRPGALRDSILRRVLGPGRALKRISEAGRAAGPGQMPFRLAALLCGEGLWGPWRLLWSRFWRHPDEVWLDPGGVPKWARSRPLFAGYRIATLTGRVAGTAVRRRRPSHAPGEQEPGA